MARIGNQLLSESKGYASGTGGKRNGRDLLSLLVRANTEPDLPKSQRMSDKDVLARMYFLHFFAHRMLLMISNQRCPHLL